MCEPRSMYDARHPPSLGGVLAPPAVTFGKWELIEDRPGKPGWISHGPNASAIEVEVDNVLPDIDPYSGTQLAPRRPTVLQLRASDAIA